MSDFLKWHPSSNKAKTFYSNRQKISDLIFLKPVKGIRFLRKDWKFGLVSEIWDDFIFENCIRPVLDRNLLEKNESAVNRYALLDHELFLTYIRREESPVRFRRAFWNINYYGNLISSKLLEDANSNNRTITPSKATFSSKRKIAFVLKGPYHLAHVEFLHSFLQGTKVFAEKIEVHLILLDDAQSTPKAIPHVSIISLADSKDAYQKIQKYIDYCTAMQFNHICWVACVQNLSLYMGMQLAETQSYWSMKYHSIIMPSMQKYAGLGFGGESFYFDDTKWFRGRAFPDLQMPVRDPALIESLRKSCRVEKDCLLVGCFVRAEKLHDKSFWNSIIEILKTSNKVHFAIASQSIPAQYLSLLKSLPPSLSNRFHSLGWVNTKNWAYALDIYFDSSPRGSCNTIFEAIEADVPVLLADSMHNRESSALPYLLAAAESSGALSNIPGVYDNEKDRLNSCVELLLSSKQRSLLASSQKKLLSLLQGQNYLFAKDYLNYFLDQNFQLSSLSK